MKRVVSAVIIAAGVSFLAAFAVYVFTDKPYRGALREPIRTARYDNPNSYSWSGNLIFTTDGNSVNSAIAARLPPGIVISDAQVFNGRIYLTDAERQRVYCFGLDGAKVWESKKFPVLNDRFPLAVSPEGELWIANAGTRAFERLDFADGEPQEVCRPKKGFGSPVGMLATGGRRFVTIDKSGRDVRLFEGAAPAKVLARNIAPHWRLYKIRESGGGIVYYDGEKNVQIEVAH